MQSAQYRNYKKKNILWVSSFKKFIVREIGQAKNILNSRYSYIIICIITYF